MSAKHDGGSGGVSSNSANLSSDPHNRKKKKKSRTRGVGGDAVAERGQLCVYLSWNSLGEILEMTSQCSSLWLLVRTGM